MNTDELLRDLIELQDQVSGARAMAMDDYNSTAIEDGAAHLLEKAHGELGAAWEKLGRAVEWVAAYNGLRDIMEVGDGAAR